MSRVISNHGRRTTMTATESAGPSFTQHSHSLELQRSGIVYSTTSTSIAPASNTSRRLALALRQQRASFAASQSPWLEFGDLAGSFLSTAGLPSACATGMLSPGKHGKAKWHRFQTHCSESYPATEPESVGYCGSRLLERINCGLPCTIPNQPSKLTQSR